MIYIWLIKITFNKKKRENIKIKLFFLSTGGISIRDIYNKTKWSRSENVIIQTEIEYTTKHAGTDSRKKVALHFQVKNVPENYTVGIFIKSFVDTFFRKSLCTLLHETARINSLTFQAMEDPDF